jgi:ribosomal protein L36
MKIPPATKNLERKCSPISRNHKRYNICATFETLKKKGAPKKKIL